MPRRLQLKRKVGGAVAAFARWQIIALAGALLVLALVGVAQYHRRSAPVVAEEADDDDSTESTASRNATQDKTTAPSKKGREVNAAWYDVPQDSLAARRADSSELTAAHNKLPLGTLVRVTHLQNGKAVTVRITDRGIRDRKVKLDLSKKAAEQLEMVEKGIARVRMEILANEAASPSSTGGSATSHP